MLLLLLLLLLLDGELVLDVEAVAGVVLVDVVAVVGDAVGVDARGRRRDGTEDRRSRGGGGGGGIHGLIELDPIDTALI